MSIKIETVKNNKEFVLERKLKTSNISKCKCENIYCDEILDEVYKVSKRGDSFIMGMCNECYKSVVDKDLNGDRGLFISLFENRFGNSKNEGKSMAPSYTFEVTESMREQLIGAAGIMGQGTHYSQETATTSTLREGEEQMQGLNYYAMASSIRTEPITESTLESLTTANF